MSGLSADQATAVTRALAAAGVPLDMLDSFDLSSLVDGDGNPDRARVDRLAGATRSTGRARGRADFGAGADRYAGPPAKGTGEAEAERRFGKKDADEGEAEDTGQVRRQHPVAARMYGETMPADQVMGRQVTRKPKPPRPSV